MHKIYGVVVLSAFLVGQSASAAGIENMSSDACRQVAKACQDAGFTREGSSGKNFWLNCMKPLFLNKTIAGVHIDSVVVKNCRIDKINEMQKELQELKVNSK